MPEGPELHMASRLINQACIGRIFTGKVIKSEVSVKNPDIEWDEKEYTISSVSRGKEVRVTLMKKQADSKKCLKDLKNVKTLDILFRFGMSGKFEFEPVNNMHKHAHLNFYSNDGMVLSFVDVRRFGRWEVNSDWGKNRGPCVLQEYELFRENVLNKLDSPVFNRPICEALLEQKFFNGIGNYLRAEILYRAGPIQPFVKARTVLEPLLESQGSEGKVCVKSEVPDILALCNILPTEVINLKGSKGYEVEKGSEDDYSEFAEWLQCYYNPKMNNMVDHNGRTIWYSGSAGPMAPQNNKSRKRKEKSHLDKKGSSDEMEDMTTGQKVGGSKRNADLSQVKREVVENKKTRKTVKQLADKDNKQSNVSMKKMKALKHQPTSDQGANRTRRQVKRLAQESITDDRKSPRPKRKAGNNIKTPKTPKTPKSRARRGKKAD